MKQTKKKSATPVAERPHKNLTETQEELAYIASDILLNGGAREDVETLLEALACHQYKSKFPPREEQDQAAFAKRIDDNAERAIERWYPRLAKLWPEKRERLETAPVNTSAPVTEMVRANIRNRFIYAVNEFLSDLDGIESLWLLTEVIENVNANKDLGEAIAYALEDQEGVYVRVPWKHQRRIQEFAKFLEGAAAA